VRGSGPSRVLAIVQVHWALALVPLDQFAEQHRRVRPLRRRALTVEQHLAEPLRLTTITRVQTRLIAAHTRKVDLPVEHPVLRPLKQPDAGAPMAEAARPHPFFVWRHWSRRGLRFMCAFLPAGPAGLERRRRDHTRPTTSRQSHVVLGAGRQRLVVPLLRSGGLPARPHPRVALRPPRGLTTGFANRVPGFSDTARGRVLPGRRHHGAFPRAGAAQSSLRQRRSASRPAASASWNSIMNSKP